MFNQKSKAVMNDHTITITGASNHQGAPLAKPSTLTGWLSVAVFLLTTLFAAGNSMNAIADDSTNTGPLAEYEFIMIDASGNAFGGIEEINFNWDGSLYTDPATQTAANMSMSSDAFFFGAQMVFHDIRGFGPGDYSFTDANGNTLTMQISEGQIGAHLLLDYNGSNDIDLLVVWDMERSSVGTKGESNHFCKSGNTLNLVTSDGNGDGISGIPFVEGPFVGFSPVFNVTTSPFSAAEWLVLCGN